MRSLVRFFREDQAATAVEYAVMLGLILMMCIVAIASVGQSSGGMWGNTKNQLNAHGF